MTIPPPPTDTATAADVGVDNSNAKPQEGKHQPQKYHALVVDSGAIIKQTSLTSSSSQSLLHAATSYYTVPSVLSEIRDPKSRHHLSQFQFQLSALHNTTLQTRLPSKEAIRTVSEFARKTGDYSQLSSVDLQILALLYDLELEAATLYHGGSMDHVRKEPKRVLGVCVQALNGGGNNSRIKNNQRGNTGDDADSMTRTQDGTDNGGGEGSEVNSISTTSNADGNGMIDAELVNIEYDDDDDDDDDDEDEDEVGGSDEGSNCGASDFASEHLAKSTSGTTTTCSAPPPSQPKSWAQLVNPQKAATAASTTTSTPPTLVNYSIVPKFQPEKPASTEDYTKMNTSASSANDVVAEGQFDDASSTDDDSEGSDDDDDESNAIQIANAPSDDEFSDEECDVFILEPHEAVYFKKLKENMKEQMAEGMSLQEKAIMHDRADYDDDGGLESEFPSLEAAAAVPYEGSDDEDNRDDETGNKNDAPQTDSNELSWQEEEEERKKKALQPMINGRLVRNEKKEMYNSFRRHGHLFSASGAAETITKHSKEEQSKEFLPENLYGNTIMLESGDSKEIGADQNATGNGNQEYKSRILGAATNVLAGSSNEADFTSEMTAEDDDGEGWVTCARDIHSMKAKGSFSITNSSSRHDGTKRSNPGKDVGPPTCQRAACATTDFAMQNVILQMNLELLSVDGVRVRRLKTWVTRCGACYTIYGSNDSKSKGGGRLFCDKCGSNTLHRIAASVDRNTGRLKLHMKKNYQYNTRGTKFSLPKPGKGNKYKGDLLLAEDQLLYGAWNQKVRMGKSKAASQSIFGSDLASDLGCISDLTKRDDIKVGFGRRNPNSSKFGRERRGKKKKNTDEKACGLRRY
ncbi:hypothetical protein ACHAXH_007184 [Discostella pseudostelligera]